MTRWICRGVVGIFAALYAIAALLLVVGTFGWFGADRDPLSGVMLILLGLPWTYFLGSVQGAILPYLVVLSPALTLLLLILACRIGSRRR